MKLRALGKNVLVYNMEKGERKTTGGIVLRDDDGKNEGIRARWAQVYAVGPDVVTVKPGQWVYIDHGKWTRALKVDPTLSISATVEEHILLISDEKPVEFAPRF